LASIEASWTVIPVEKQTFTQGTGFEQPLLSGKKDLPLSRDGNDELLLEIRRLKVMPDRRKDCGPDEASGGERETVDPAKLKLSFRRRTIICFLEDWRASAPHGFPVKALGSRSPLLGNHF